ncbi:ATP-grasp domain-containing protein [Streptomyces sp. NBC_01408]|uniref:ATP-grasp domain-containing protein n=1 Tax=Streptomyces sp. NBC_01408 TaxID=2903855 RepID=UPI0022526D57|nr:ATP-grasp domain-containing protein [Streptomyces sp. NBC_01408]MCX4696581.1 ATP-grasp domain-containing protein [Streptomyces sp. NBC_01408]
MHVVLLETASIRGFDIVAELADDGIEVSFVTERLDAYRGKPGFELISRAARVVEVPELAGCQDLATLLHGRLGPHRPDGVICRDEVHLHSAALLARDLGLPHESLQAARLLGDKGAVRERLGKAGIGSLRWRRAVTEEEGLAAVEEIGLPCVVKPTAGGWSVGVTVAWTREQAAGALAEVLGVPLGPGGEPPVALVEEYAVGRHVSAELLVQDGRTVVLGFAERLPAPAGTTAELGGHFPARFEGLGAARRFVLDAVEALGIRASALHVELLMTPTGPELIEVNGRIAGHVVTRQMSLALGRSIARDLVALATGTPVADEAPPVATVALHTLWSETGGVVRGAVPTPAELPAGVIDCQVGVGAGDRVPVLATNHDRFGYVMVTGADAEQAATAAAEAAERVRESLRLEPAGTGSGSGTDFGSGTDSDSGTFAVAAPAAGGEHLVLLLDGDDPVERIVTAAGAVTARLTVLRRDELTFEEARSAFRRAHARHPVAGVLSWSAAYETEARNLRRLAQAGPSGDPAEPAQLAEPGLEELELEELGLEELGLEELGLEELGLEELGLDGLEEPGLEEPAFVRDPVHTVLAVAHGRRVDVLAVVDESEDQGPGAEGTERRMTAGAVPEPLAARAERAVRDAAVEGPARVVFGGDGQEPLVLAGFDERVLDLYDAVHRRSLVTAAARSALGRPVGADLPDAGRTALQRILSSASGRFRIVAATMAEELYDWPELARARTPLGRRGTHTGPAPRLLYTVAARSNVAAERAADRIERSLVWRTEPADRTHVLLLDRIGPSVWTRDDGSPLLDPDRFRVSMLGSAARGEGAATDFDVRTDVFDEEAVRAFAGAVNALHPVDRVATVSERLQEPAAALRKMFGATGDDPATARKFVDKAVMKRIARRAGIRTADGHLVHTPEDVTAVFGRHGKVVVKPRAGSGSSGVSVLRDFAQVERWVREEFQPGTHLCEGFVDGDMCHIDAVLYEGDLVWDVSRYETDTLSVARSEPLSSVTVADPALRAEAHELLGQVIDAWQVRTGVLHLEAFVGPTGLTFCEVAARPGGAGITEAFRATTGIDLDHAKICTDAGADPRIGRRAPVAAYAGWTVHYTRGGTLLDFDDSAVAEDAYFRGVPYRIGDVVPAQRFSGSGVSTHVFAHDSHTEVKRLVARAEREVRLVLDPGPGPRRPGAGGAVR